MKQRDPIEHELKCWPEFFDALRSGAKRFEARRFDRDYQVGDVLVEKEWKPNPGGGWWSAVGKYTGRVDRYRITYILKGSAQNKLTGIDEGFCVMSVARLKRKI